VDKTDGAERDRPEFAAFPALREVMDALPRAKFRGFQETVGLRVTPLHAYERIRGLFEMPKSSVDSTVVYTKPEQFAEWIRSGLSGVDFSEGCSFWIGIHRPQNTAFPWIEVEVDGADALLPLWFELKSQVVMIFSPASYCIVAFFEEENGWEMYRQP
jgi:hypothetical protein